MRTLRPASLMGQMLLAVAAALLLVQGLGAALVYRAQRERFQVETMSALAFRLIAETRGIERAPRKLRMGPRGFFGDRLHRFAVEARGTSPLQAGERRDAGAEQKLREILASQDFGTTEVVVLRRPLASDPYAEAALAKRADRIDLPAAALDRAMDADLYVAGVRSPQSAGWMVARVRAPPSANALLIPLTLQTLALYVVLVGVVALILRRITRPLNALTRQVARFAATQDPSGQVEPMGPQDVRQLIVALNAMEWRISSLLDEKDVMLGAIGHDLKTPLAALRVRIESVEDDTERLRMAATIEDIVRTLDDILSLARVGRPSDPLERNELSALVASVVEEYEDMAEPVELGETERLVLEVRPTWLRRALRNLIGNALRYGERARVSLERQNGFAVIRIDDDGPGIPETSLEAMTQPFMRGDPSRNSETGGAGLGLALARAIAEQHGGALHLANRRRPDGTVEGLTAELALPLT
ncbi:ATP-binding protein [Novosphingobium sp. 9U]|uniref:sensor histidine kinase n=1 Tax=Novosphingobium sp. 9U TaxID=2653158 RepID=UPI0012F12942|nr:ATP-binding protein [Novosphingobium sp. 9U]VWX53354.1 Histidine kinase [Novosphingobium sp. 9U]